MGFIDVSLTYIEMSRNNSLDKRRHLLFIGNVNCLFAPADYIGNNLLMSKLGSEVKGSLSIIILHKQVRFKPTNIYKSYFHSGFLNELTNFGLEFGNSEAKCRPHQTDKHNEITSVRGYLLRQ